MGQHLSEKTKTGRRHIRMTRWTKNPTNGIRPGILIGGQEHLVNPITTPKDHQGWTHGMGAPTGRELPNLTTRDAHKGPPQAEDRNKVPSNFLVMATLHKNCPRPSVSTQRPRRRLRSSYIRAQVTKLSDGSLCPRDGNSSKPPKRTC